MKHEIYKYQELFPQDNDDYKVCSLTNSTQ